MLCIPRILAIPVLRNMPKNYSKYLKADAGIRQRKKFLDSNDDLEDVDLDYEMEADFMDVHKSHKEYEEEMELLHEKQKYHIVKQKYFKEKFPNFLTWNEKEHIRYLHSTDPDEWTTEKLSEGFPALPEVIKKIIKSKWTKDSSKIANHDYSVKKNWEMFKEGLIPDLPKELEEHLKKFTDRSNFPTFEVPTKKTVVINKQQNRFTEFSEIISSYDKLKNKDKQETQENYIDVNKSLLPPTDKTDTCLIGDKRKIRGKDLTLNELQDKIERRAMLGKQLSEEDKLLLKRTSEKSEENILVELKNEDFTSITQNKYEPSKNCEIMRKTERDYSHLIYPEKIIIPSKIRKRGYTYKLNDCFYDSDGLFLYRVPGMG